MSSLLSLYNAKTVDDVMFCIQRGDNINDTSKFYSTPFIVQCKYNNIPVVTALLENGCDVKIFDRYQKSGLDYVCQLGHTDLLQILVGYDRILDIINPENGSENSPLSICCKNGHTDIFDILIKYGADANYYNIIRFTPLISACENDHIDIVDRLLNYNIDVNFTDSNGMTSLFHTDSVTIIKKLILYGADPNIISLTGHTTLCSHLKYSDPNIEIIETLLKGGCDPNIGTISRIGLTSLLYALQRHLDQIVQLLLAYGADPYITDNEGRDAYDYGLQ